MKFSHKLILWAVLITGIVSCKEDFLDEVPLSFLSTSNAYQTEADFAASTNNLYGLVRAHYYQVNDNTPFQYQYRSDAFLESRSGSPNLPGDISPTGVVGFAWGPNYKIIAEANTIISRIPGSALTDAQKLVFEARARFFRAFAYRALAYLYGGVPLVLEEIETPKTDFTRATRKQVYAQAIQDLEFAVTNLPPLTGTGAVRDGEISKQAANHLLAEVYIADGQFQKAVDAATAVIATPNVSLMTARFGSRQSIPAAPPYPAIAGDVYWDLFQPRNQNRGSGNREAIWVVQFETDVPGGGLTTTGGNQNNVYALERVHVPLFRDVTINGVAPFRWPISDFTGGRGVGFMAPSPWFADSVWKNSGTDIRNANHNFVRDFIGTNPASPFYGLVVSSKAVPPGSKGFNGETLVTGKQNSAFYPYQSKATTPFLHPTPLFINPNRTDPVTKWELNTGAGGTFRDEYIFRLAETYLLRAEAYLGLGKTTEAATDINVVRNRSQATPVTPGQVNIDYILDERLRELGVEEKRNLTLMRMGKWVDRLRRCNPFFAPQLQEHFNLWPIPFNEIERNRTAKLEQNPGYPQ